MCEQRELGFDCEQFKEWFVVGDGLSPVSNRVFMFGPTSVTVLPFQIYLKNKGSAVIIPAWSNNNKPVSACNSLVQ